MESLFTMTTGDPFFRIHIISWKEWYFISSHHTRDQLGHWLYSICPVGVTVQIDQITEEEYLMYKMEGYAEVRGVLL